MLVILSSQVVSLFLYTLRFWLQHNNNSGKCEEKDGKFHLSVAPESQQMDLC